MDGPDLVGDIPACGIPSHPDHPGIPGVYEEHGYGAKPALGTVCKAARIPPLPCNPQHASPSANNSLACHNDSLHPSCGCSSSARENSRKNNFRPYILGLKLGLSGEKTGMDPGSSAGSNVGPSLPPAAWTGDCGK